MKDAATILSGLNFKEAMINGYRKEIRIEYDHTDLLLHYEENSEEKGLGCGYFKIDEADLNQLVIDSVCLSGGCDAREEVYLKNKVSYTATMYCLIRQIQQKHPNAIKSFNVGIYEMDDCYLMGCPEMIEYGYRIYLHREFWEDSTELHSLMTGLWDGTLSFRDCYAPYIGSVLADNYLFEFLSTNTKVRRLGYLSLLLSLFENTPKIAKKNLSRLLEQKAIETRNALDSYKNQKGIIIPSKTGISANPYIKLALEIGVIREMTGHYELGKMGRVYVEVNKMTHISPPSNPFELTDFEKVFWMERLLERDFVYLLILLEYSFVSEKPSYADLRKKFDGLVVKKLEILHDTAYDILPKTALRNAILRIKGWKKSEIYLEHVLMPRLNWLYDLGVLELNKDLSFTLTKEGCWLFLHLSEWRDLGQTEICNPSSYLETFYMHIANDVFMECEGNSGTDVYNALNEALVYSFEHFKTMAPNRVTFSVYQAFAKYTLLKDKKMVVESTEIKENYLPSVADKYIFMYQRYYNDGFIQKK